MISGLDSLEISAISKQKTPCNEFSLFSLTGLLSRQIENHGQHGPGYEVTKSSASARKSKAVKNFLCLPWKNQDETYRYITIYFIVRT